MIKQNEKPEVILLIAEDAILIKIIAAWTNLNIKQTAKLNKIKGKSENEIWNCLWSCIYFDIEEIKKTIGYSYSESFLRNKIQLLINNRIVYPDGTINSFAQRFLREHILKLLDVKSQKIK